MLSATAFPHGTIQQYNQEVADPSYRPKVIQYPVKAEITGDKLELSTQKAKLTIDHAPCYRDMNLYINNTELVRHIADTYRQAFAENLDAVVSEGRFLAAIEKGNSVPQLIVSQIDTSMPTVDLKPKSPPTITYQPAQVHTDYTPGDVTMVPAEQGVGLNIIV